MKCIVVLLFLISFVNGSENGYVDAKFRLFRRKWVPEVNVHNSDEFLARASNLLRTCQHNLRQTEAILQSSAKIQDMLSDVNKLNFTGQIEHLEDFAARNNELESFEEMSLNGGNIFSRISDFLTTIQTACDMLPEIASEFDKDQNVEHLIESLIVWVDITITQIESEAIRFFTIYENDPHWDEVIGELHHVMIKMTEEKTFRDLLEFTVEIMEDLKKDAPRSARKLIGRVEELLLPFGDFLQEPSEDEYWITNFKKTPSISSLPDTSRFGGKPKKNIYGEVEIDTTLKIAELPLEFLSMAIGSKLIQNKFMKIPKKRERFLNLASLFSPSILRVGGSAANFLTYDPTREENDIIPSYKGWGTQEEYEMAHLHPKFLSHKKECSRQLEKKDFTNFTMTGADWDFLIGLARDLEWPILFDLNQMKRRTDGSWDSSNADLLLNDHATRNFPIIWQLGNEPNAYKHLFGWSIAPEHAAEDYHELRRKIEANLFPVGSYFLVGPDVTRPRKFDEVSDLTFENLEEDSMKYLRKFLQEGKDAVDAVTWHQYYMNGRTATTKDFLSVEMMNRFPKQVSEIVGIRDSFAPQKPIWLTETANAWGGGAPALSGGFAGTFLWLDKLGAAAFGGISMIFRQTLVGGCYGLIDKNMNPLSNYWVSALHKEIVGQTVLLPRVRMASENIRLYAHCLKPTNYMYKKGAIVIFGMNVGDEPESLSIVNPELAESEFYNYRLTAPLNDMTSSSVLLNGELLEVGSNGLSPAFTPRLVFSKKLIFSPKSINFFVFPDANNPLCN